MVMSSSAPMPEHTQPSQETAPGAFPHQPGFNSTASGISSSVELTKPVTSPDSVQPQGQLQLLEKNASAPTAVSTTDTLMDTGNNSNNNNNKAATKKAMRVLKPERHIRCEFKFGKSVARFWAKFHREYMIGLIGASVMKDGLKELGLATEEQGSYKVKISDNSGFVIPDSWALKDIPPVIEFIRVELIDLDEEGEVYDEEEEHEEAEEEEEEEVEEEEPEEVVEAEQEEDEGEEETSEEEEEEEEDEYRDNSKRKRGERKAPSKRAKKEPEPRVLKPKSAKSVVDPSKKSFKYFGKRVNAVESDGEIVRGIEGYRIKAVLGYTRVGLGYKVFTLGADGEERDFKLSDLANSETAKKFCFGQGDAKLKDHFLRFRQKNWKS